VAFFEAHTGCIDHRTTGLLSYQYTGEPGYHEESRGIGIYPVGVISSQGQFFVRNLWLCSLSQQERARVRGFV
jgi:hypothetical protein